MIDRLNGTRQIFRIVTNGIRTIEKTEKKRIERTERVEKKKGRGVKSGEKFE